MLEHSRPARICGSNTTAALTGLALAWVGTALLISPLARNLDDPSRPSLALVGQALFWALAVAVVAIIRFWEKQPLRSLWLKQFRWQSIAWGLLLVPLTIPSSGRLEIGYGGRQGCRASAPEWTK